jgi:tRNA A-37 threonylcarbamoyl transferase component Bud32
MKYCDTCHATYPSDFSSCPKDQTLLRLTTDLVPGMVIRDKYEIVEKIGAGGMATVYRAKHLVFNEPRAIKVVSSRMMEDANFLKRFRNEAVIMRKLQHPNAVRVDDIDSIADGRPCIIMELVEGRNLRSVIEQEGPFPVARVLEIGRQAAAALGAAHRLGITHRDIKPDNIILRQQPDGKDLAKVLDFGIAKLKESESGGAYTATQTGTVIGTPQYMSPEQASGKRFDEIDGRADLYSLGVVMFEMLTGRLPFQSDTPMGMLLQHMKARVPPPREVRPDLNIPEGVSQLLMKMLEKDPGRRFQSAEEMIAALEHPDGRQFKAAATTTQVMASGEYPAPRITASAASADAPTAGISSATAQTPLVTPAAAPSSGAGKWIAAAVIGAVLLAGGYVAVSRRSAPAASNAATTTAPAASAPQALSATTVAAPAATQNVADAQKVQPDRRVRELLVSGQKHMDSGEYDAAIRDQQKALQLEPDNAAARAALERAQQAKRTEQQVLGRQH